MFFTCFSHISIEKLLILYYLVIVRNWSKTRVKNSDVVLTAARSAEHPKKDSLDCNKKIDTKHSICCLEFVIEKKVFAVCTCNTR